MSLVLSIDLGTTNIKAGVVDADGKVLSIARRNPETFRSEPGAAEHCPEQLYTLAMEVCKQALVGYQKDISAVALSSYHFGLLALDKNFSPMGKLSTLLDTRSQKTFDAFLNTYDKAKIYYETGCPPYTQHVLPRLFYFKKNKPEYLENASYFASSKSWLLYKLTGEFISDPGTESATQLLNLEELNWSSNLLGSLGLNKSQFARLVEPCGETFKLLPKISEELGLNKDVVLVPSLYDGAAVALGLNCYKAGTAFSNIGTTAPLRVSHEGPAFDNSDSMRFQPYYFMNGKFLVGGAINNASLPLRWIKENLLNVEYDEIDSLAKQSPAGANGVYFLPYLSGERDIKIGSVASGVFFGLRESSDRSDVVRAMLEGVAYNINMIKSGMQECNIPLDIVSIGGGGIRNAPCWLNIFANVLNLKLETCDNEEPCLIGDAICAYTATGKFSDIQEAADHMVRRQPTASPDKICAEQYEKLFSFYKEIYNQTASLFWKHAEFRAGIKDFCTI